MMDITKRFKSDLTVVRFNLLNYRNVTDACCPLGILKFVFDKFTQVA